MKQVEGEIDQIEEETFEDEISDEALEATVNTSNCMQRTVKDTKTTCGVC